MALLTLRYDMRAPAFSDTRHPEQYQVCLEQSAWADERGFTTVVVSEHHGVEDGYISSPLVLAAAIAGRTKNVGLTVSALLVPLHDPLRLAEDLAVLDLASGGRLTIVAGLGYRPEEFEMLGVDRTKRGKLLDEYLDVLRQAWTGEPFEFRGRTVRVTPRPATEGTPLMLVGGSSEIAAKRAARHRMGFMPAVNDPELADAYEQACKAEGFDGGFTILPSGPGFLHVTDDPERAWATIAPHAMHEARTYASWQTDGQRSQVTTYAEDPDELLKSGVYKVVTPDECVAFANEQGPMGALVFHPLMGGMPPELGWESLELFADKVLPRLG